MTNFSETHRPGPLKQVNKTSKVKKSKKSNSNDNKPKAKNVLKMTKAEKKNMALQQKALKMNKVKEMKKLRGVEDVPPIFVSFISLDPDFNSEFILNWIVESTNLKVISSTSNTIVCFSKRHNKIFQLAMFTLPSLNVINLASIGSLSDFVFLFCDTDHSIVYEDATKQKLKIILSNGCSDLGYFIKKCDDVDGCYCNQKKHTHFLTPEQSMPFESSGDLNMLLHKTSKRKGKAATDNSIRSAMYVDKYVYDAESGELEILGFVRNNGLTHSCPIFLSGVGDKIVKEIQVIQPTIDDSKEQNFTKIYECSEAGYNMQLESLNAMNIDKKIAEIRNSMDSDMAVEDEFLQSDNEEGKSNAVEFAGDARFGMVTHNGQDDKMSQATNITEATKSFIKENEYDSDDEEETDEESDDQVNTREKFKPTEIIRLEGENARDKLKFYKGIENLKKYNWDLTEYLPIEYSELYKFKDYAYQRKVILENCDKANTLNRLCRIKLANVSQEEFNAFDQQKMHSAFGSLLYEGVPCQMSCLITLDLDCLAEYKSGKNYVIQIDNRVFEVPVIFAEECYINKKQVLKKVPNGFRHVLANFFAPMMITNSSVMIYNLYGELIGQGTIKNYDTDVVLYVKKQLHGKIDRSNAKSALVKGMFFNKEDVEWFMPVPLVNEQNLMGYVKSSLGTHGHFKCRFEKKVTLGHVYMNLYKRVFPKWNFNYVLK